jgi:hypothetical protein
MNPTNPAAVDTKLPCKINLPSNAKRRGNIRSCRACSIALVVGEPL